MPVRADLAQRLRPDEQERAHGERRRPRGGSRGRAAVRAREGARALVEQREQPRVVVGVHVGDPDLRGHGAAACEMPSRKSQQNIAMSISHAARMRTGQQAAGGEAIRSKSKRVARPGTASRARATSFRGRGRAGTRGAIGRPCGSAAAACATLLPRTELRSGPRSAAGRSAPRGA